MTRLLIVGAIPGPSTYTKYLHESEDDTTLLISVPAGWPAKVIEHSACCREHHVPRGEQYADGYHPSESVDPHIVALARTARRDEPLRRAFLTLAEEVDVIVHTTAALFDLDERCGSDGKVRVYAPETGPEYLSACRNEPESPGSHEAFPVHVLEARLVAAAGRLETSAPEHRASFELWYDTAPTRRPHVVLVNDYPLDTPGGGGHVRMRELYSAAASAGLHITLVCFSDAAGRRDTALAPHLHQIAIPKSSAHRQLQQSVDAVHPNSAADITSLLCCRDNAQFEAEFRAALITADIVVFEHAYIAPLAELIPAGIPVVYSAQNVETVLKPGIYATHPLRATLTEAVQLAEEDMVTRATALVCVSPEDAEHFRAITPKPVHVVANGVRVDENWSDTENREGVAFIGSGHGPNVEAVRFILSSIAPQFPDVPFRIIGSVNGAVRQLVAEGISVPPNVEFTGIISTSAKNELLRRSAIGLNPMFSGSGSNLKLPEYFAARLPVVSTPFGARGFAVSDGVHLRITEAGSFAAVLRELLIDAHQCSVLTDAAWQYVRRDLSWRTLGVRLRDVLWNLLDHGRVRTVTFEDRGSTVSVCTDHGQAIQLPASPRCVPDLRSQHEPSRDIAAEDAAMRSCSATSPETERFIALYIAVMAHAVVRCGGPRSALRRAARLLQISAVPTGVYADLAPEDRSLLWDDTLFASTTEPMERSS